MSGADEWTAAEASARAALATHAETAHLAETRLTKIDLSLSNFAWRADNGNQRSFVRLARVGSEALGADLRAEARILHLVGAAGLSPPVVRCDPSQRLLVTRWVDGFAAKVEGHDVGAVETVAQALAFLHRLEVPADLRAIRFDTQARMLRSALPATTTGAYLDGIAADVFAQLEAERAAPVLCHHDVHAKNMIVDADRRLWLVDWEYAGLNDPAFDLASFASQCEMPPAATRRFCAAYAGAGGAIDEGRLELARWAFDYVQWLWYRSLHTSASAGHGVQAAALRSDWIERSLLERASVLLRCNNRSFGQ